MRSKYKRRENKDKIDINDKKKEIIKSNINHSRAIDIKRTKDKKVENVIFERTKPFYNRYEKINQIKEKNFDKNKKEEILKENEKEKRILNNKNNKETQNTYKKLNINTNKDEKKNLQENKLNEINSSKLMSFKPRANHFYKHNRISNDKNSNKEIIKNNNQLNNEINKKSEINKKEISSNNNNNNIKYIYQKENPNKNINTNDNKIYNINVRTKRNIPSQTDFSLKLNYPNNNEQKILNKEINNKNSASSVLEVKNRNPKNELSTRQSFKYLVHQASKSRDISTTFQRCYEKRQLISREQSQENILKDNTLKSEENSITRYKYRNLNLLKSFSAKNNDSIASINSNMKENRINCLTDRKMEISLDKNNLNSVKIINFKYNVNSSQNKDINIENNNQYIDLNTDNKPMTQNIINNNIYNTTLNFYKIDNSYKSKYFPKSKYFSTNNIMENNDIIYEDGTNLNNIYNKLNLNNINNIDYSNRYKKCEDSNLVSSSNIKQSIILINLDKFLSLEKIIKILLEKINKYQNCEKECLEYILYFFNNKFYNEEIKAFKFKHTKNNFLDNVKIELLCFFLCYDILFCNNFNQTAILFKTIFNLIHTNFLIFISYLINNVQININKYNQKILEDLNEIIKQDLKVKLEMQDIDEYNILQLINNNSKNINNYYKMVIDNLYSQYYQSNINDMRFPQCLNNKNILSNLSEDELKNIKSSFFFDAYRLLTNYNFDDLYNFFNLFLKRKVSLSNRKLSEKNFNSTGYSNIINNNKIQEKSKLNNDTKLEKYLLPKISNNYKYSLVLDLDETLVCIKRDNNNRIKLDPANNLITLILRPGLLDFLHKMKKIYELILFSLGTSEYVSPIIKNIEKNEKFFEHVLYRQHVSYDNGYFFKNLNLLNRDVKNIIIVDDNYKNFKYHKSNGICIKPFFGDSLNDKNTLKILGNILYKIRYDADLTGDIRISLNKEKNSILFSQIANNY